MAIKKSKLAAGIKTKAGDTHVLTSRAVFAAPNQSLDDFDETMIGADFPFIQPTVIRGGCDVSGLLWQKGDPILAEFTADNEMELAIWTLEEGGFWHWGRYVLPDAAPQDFNGLYSFSGSWPLNSEGVAGQQLSSTLSSIPSMDVPASAYGFVYSKEKTTITLTVSSGGTDYTISLSGGEGFACALLVDSSGNQIPSDLSSATITVAAGATGVWGIGRELTI